MRNTSSCSSCGSSCSSDDYTATCVRKDTRRKRIVRKTEASVAKNRYSSLASVFGGM